MPTLMLREPEKLQAVKSLAVGGVTPFTTIDFPGKLSAVIFCQGCPLRCGYCQNPDLINACKPGRHSWSEIVAFLETRRGLIDAVVFSGGEPLTQSALIPAMGEVKAMGFAVGLHTSGVAPARLRAALAHADWVGFDVKAPFEAYEAITRVAGSGEKARAALLELVGSGLPFEARTTLDPEHLGESGVLALAEEIAAIGARDYALQAMRPVGETRAPRLPAWARRPDFRAALEARFASVEYREA